MACVVDPKDLSPDEQKMIAVMTDEYVTVEQVAKQTGLPLFRVRSFVRNLKALEAVIEIDDTFTFNKEV